MEPWRGRIGPSRVREELALSWVCSVDTTRQGKLKAKPFQEARIFRGLRPGFGVGVAISSYSRGDALFTAEGTITCRRSPQSSAVFLPRKEVVRMRSRVRQVPVALGPVQSTSAQS